jgi:hypothetical protein
MLGSTLIWHQIVQVCESREKPIPQHVQLDTALALARDSNVPLGFILFCRYLPSGVRELLSHINTDPAHTMIPFV